jgi:hypothetical protein
MKLWHSFVKEMLLASRSFYFWIEIFMAGMFLFLLMFVIPENFSSTTDEYIYWDVPDAAVPFLEEEYLSIDEDGIVETVELEYGDEIYLASLYAEEDSNFYVLEDEAATIGIADEEKDFAAIVHIDDAGEVSYTYYMQGYETERLRNLYLIFHNVEMEELTERFDAQDVRPLHENQVLLSDRQNVVPSILTFNGSLMGLFIIASYIFLDKKEGVIKAYAVTVSPVWQYLLSKVGVIMVVSTLTSFLITIPIMGGQPNYPLMLVFLLTTGFAASALGLVLTSFYENIQQAFGMLYTLVIALMLPNIAYFIPTWNPRWMTFVPTQPMLQGFKELMLPGGDVNYVLMASAGFFIAGLLLFIFANARFKRTLTV